MIHADHAYDLEGDAPHGQHGAEGDAPRQVRPAFMRIFKGVLDIRFDHLAADPDACGGDLLNIAQALQRGTHGLHPGGEKLVRFEELVQQRRECLRPELQGLLFPKRHHPREQGCEESEERAQHPGAVTLHIVIGQDRSEPARPFGRHGISQQQPVETEAPGVLVRIGHARLTLPVLVIAPPDPALLNPSQDQLQIIFVQTEFFSYLLRLQQCNHLRCFEPAGVQFENADQWLRQRAFRLQRPVGHGEWNKGGAVPGDIEYGVDIGRIDFDIRRHDHDILGLQVGVLIEQGQEIVPEHLYLAHGAVA